MSDLDAYDEAQCSAQESDQGNEVGSPEQTCEVETAKLTVTVTRTDPSDPLDQEITVVVNGTSSRSGKVAVDTPLVFDPIDPGDYEVGATLEGWRVVNSIGMSLAGSGDHEVTLQVTRRILEIAWDKEKARCSDAVKLEVTSQALAAGRTKAKVTSDGKQVTELEADTAEKHTFDLTVKDQPFTGAAMPEHRDFEAEAAADGMTARAPKPLRLERVPDMPLAPVSFHLTSGIYGWDAKFKAGITKEKAEISLTLVIEKAWLGKQVVFDPDPAADGKAGTFYVKKVGAAWKYWDSGATPKAWTALPRAIGSYAVTSIVFVKSGTKYVSRDDATVEWPEAFTDPANYDTKKDAWLKNIHDVWDDKFDLVHDDCKSEDAKKCRWRLRLKAAWHATTGDKKVYAIHAQDWERSNAKDWYLSEHRLGVAGHEAGHLLGAYDEYAGGATDPADPKIEDDTIMGQNLTKALPRHLNGLRDQLAKLVNDKISRTWKFAIQAKA